MWSWRSIKIMIFWITSCILLLFRQSQPNAIDRLALWLSPLPWRTLHCSIFAMDRLTMTVAELKQLTGQRLGTILSLQSSDVEAIVRYLFSLPDRDDVQLYLLVRLFLFSQFKRNFWVTLMQRSYINSSIANSPPPQFRIQLLVSERLILPQPLSWHSPPKHPHPPQLFKPNGKLFAFWIPKPKPRSWVPNRREPLEKNSLWRRLEHQKKIENSVTATHRSIPWLQIATSAAKSFARKRVSARVHSAGVWWTTFALAINKAKNRCNVRLTCFQPTAARSVVLWVKQSRSRL